tara:strand:+ start:851 stop:1078 length:228 start_codon:yes stop_codon:yes gene_type:complete
MKSIALFLLLFLIYYITYSIMKNKLNQTEKDIEIKFKEVPKTLIEEQYDFDVSNYFFDIKNQDNLWKLYGGLTGN